MVPAAKIFIYVSVYLFFILPLNVKFSVFSKVDEDIFM